MAAMVLAAEPDVARVDLESLRHGAQLVGGFGQRGLALDVRHVGEAV
jgi:hypothetical protein